MILQTLKTISSYGTFDLKVVEYIVELNSFFLYFKNYQLLYRACNNDVLIPYFITYQR